MTTGALGPAIVAIRRPLAEVARRRAPLGPSEAWPFVVSTSVAVGAPASPVTIANLSLSIQTGGAATTGMSIWISNAVPSVGSMSTTLTGSSDSRSPASIANRPPWGSQVAK